MYIYTEVLVSPDRLLATSDWLYAPRTLLNKAKEYSSKLAATSIYILFILD